jgi:hypothetical protein
MVTVKATISGRPREDLKELPGYYWPLQATARGFEAWSRRSGDQSRDPARDFAGGVHIQSVTPWHAWTNREHARPLVWATRGGWEPPLTWRVERYRNGAAQADRGNALKLK